MRNMTTILEAIFHTRVIIAIMGSAIHLSARTLAYNGRDHVLPRGSAHFLRSSQMRKWEIELQQEWNQ